MQLTLLYVAASFISSYISSVFGVIIGIMSVLSLLQAYISNTNSNTNNNTNNADTHVSKDIIAVDVKHDKATSPILFVVTVFMSILVLWPLFAIATIMTSLAWMAWPLLGKACCIVLFGMLMYSCIMDAVHIAKQDRQIHTKHIKHDENDK